MDPNRYSYNPASWNGYSVSPDEETPGMINYGGTSQVHGLPAAPDQDMSYTRGTRPAGGTMMTRDYSGYSSHSSNSQAQAPIPSPEPAVQYSGTYDEYQYNLSADVGYDQQGLLAIPRYSSHQSQSQVSPTQATYHPSQYMSNERHAPAGHPTPQSLGWSGNSKIWKKYQFKFAEKKFPHLELCPNVSPSASLPLVVYLEPPRDTKTSHGYFCQHPDCAGKKKGFKRSADLGRHYSGSHAPTEEREQFPCCYRKCSRSKKAFGRKDHYRDHLREYHKEDLPGKRFTSTASREEWWAERKNDETWWRCTKCLEKVVIATTGYTCGTCNIPCELDRAQARENMTSQTGRSASRFSPDYVEKTEHDPDDLDDERGLEAHNTGAEISSAYYPHCGTCNGQGWMVQDEQYVPCSYCRGGASSSLGDTASSGWNNYEYQPYSNFQQ